jgi:hypothetical protein
MADDPDRICLISPWMTNGNIVQFLKANSRADRRSLVRADKHCVAFVLKLHSCQMWLSGFIICIPLIHVLFMVTSKESVFSIPPSTSLVTDRCDSRRTSSSHLHFELVSPILAYVNSCMVPECMSLRVQALAAHYSGKLLSYSRTRPIVNQASPATYMPLVVCVMRYACLTRPCLHCCPCYRSLWGAHPFTDINPSMLRLPSPVASDRPDRPHKLFSTSG